MLPCLWLVALIHWSLHTHPKSSFRRRLNHKESPHWVAPHVWFGKLLKRWTPDRHLNFSNTEKRHVIHFKGRADYWCQHVHTKRFTAFTNHSHLQESNGLQRGSVVGAAASQREGANHIYLFMWCFSKTKHFTKLISDGAKSFQKGDSGWKNIKEQNVQNTKMTFTLIGGKILQN